MMRLVYFGCVLFILLICISGGRASEEDTSESNPLLQDTYHHEASESERSKYISLDTDKEGVTDKEEGYCLSEAGEDGEESYCEKLSRLKNEEVEAFDIDQGELLMLGQEDKDILNEKLYESHQEGNTDSLPAQQQPQNVEGDNQDVEEKGVKDAGGGVTSPASDQDDTEEEDELGPDTSGSVSLEEAVLADEEQELEKNELDPELENVPLREILLKLKPEGLTDDEDDQSSDYSVTEENIDEESEVEEEVLLSSGSEKQEDSPDNGTKNGDDGNGSSSSSGGSSKKAVCSEHNVTEPLTDVEIINATALMKLLQVNPNVTSRSSAGHCYLIYFFSPYCPFSVHGSPYVNALARSVPNIPVFGLDSIEHHSVNARYGVMGTPTLILFHNGNAVGRYNASEYSVYQLMSFVRHYTDQDIVSINVTSVDFRAKLPSQMAEVRPYILWAAWIFLISLASWLFLTSEMCARLTEAILNNWREAEAQNDHQD